MRAPHDGRSGGGTSSPTLRFLSARYRTEKDMADRKVTPQKKPENARPGEDTAEGKAGQGSAQDQYGKGAVTGGERRIETQRWR